MPEEEDVPFVRKIAFGFYALLLFFGIAFYFGWSLWFGTWNPLTRDNIGVYAVTVVLVGFGLTGMLLYRRP